MILKGYRYELFPDLYQRSYLDRQFECGRFVWNKLVENFNSWTPESKPTKLTEKELKEEFAFLGDAASVVLQQKRIDFDNTKKQYFNVARKVKIGTMKKKTADQRQSFRIPAQAIGRESAFGAGIIFLPKCHMAIKFINHNPFKGDVRSVTVSLERNGRYFISFLVATKHEVLPSVDRSVAIAFDQNQDVILSSGVKFHHPKTIAKATNTLERAKRQMAKCEAGSKNKEQARLRITKWFKRIHDIKTAFYQELSTYIVSNYDSIHLEDVTGNIGRDDESIGMFATMLEYKCQWNERSLNRFKIQDKNQPLDATIKGLGISSATVTEGEFERIPATLLASAIE